MLARAGGVGKNTASDRYAMHDNGLSSLTLSTSGFLHWSRRTHLTTPRFNDARANL